jgi:hypothetical protein
MSDDKEKNLQYIDAISGYYKDKEITLSDNTTVSFNPLTFYETVDFFASRYSLGGCKSLEEFIDMINNTDPEVINLLLRASNVNEERKWGSNKNNTFDNKNRSKSKFNNPIRQERFVNGVGAMSDFLKSCGVNKEEINKGIDEIDSRKIEFEDYSWVNSNNLKEMSEDEFKQLLSKISEENKKCVNFKITLESIERKQNGR